MVSAPTAIAYSASKHATKCAAAELGPYNIRVNSVHPESLKLLWPTNRC
ncbi:SDR family oxidoreductase [Peribacillus sp. NPDC097295]